jgi:putative MATE family efflux protein
MIGMLFQSISLAINAAQRGAGNTRISMTTNVIANIINCIFNALLINGLFFFPRLGVVGAAIATMIGNIVACGISLASVLKKDQFLQLQFSRMFRLRGENLKLILRIGSSAIVDQVFLRIGFFMISKLVAELGTLEYATHTICMSICSLSFCVGDGLSVASSALVGQNLGRKRPDHSIIYGKTGQRIGFLAALVLFVLFTACGRWIIQLFMTDEAEAEQILEIGAKLLVILAFISPAQISQVVFIGCLRGAGDVKFSATVSLICVAVLRPMLTYLLCYVMNFGVIGAWVAMLIDQYTRLVLNALRFSGGKWAKIIV